MFLQINKISNKYSFHKQKETFELTFKSVKSGKKSSTNFNIM